MRADVEHLRLFVERQIDHWTVGVLNRNNGAWLYRAYCSREANGRVLLVEFASSELGRAVRNEELDWVEVQAWIPDGATGAASTPAP